MILGGTVKWGNCWYLHFRRCPTTYAEERDFNKKGCPSQPGPRKSQTKILICKRSSSIPPHLAVLPQGAHFVRGLHCAKTKVRTKFSLAATTQWSSLWQTCNHQQVTMATAPYLKFEGFHML
jgi:hypothetical protein